MSYAVAGVAAFPDLSINKSGTGYVLSAATSVLSPITGNAFSVSPGLPAKLAFTIQPSSTIAGATISPAVQVAVQDALGNTVGSANPSVTLAITPGTGTSTATLGGTTTVVTVAGMATFANLSLDKSGASYTLTATASGLASATSAAFTVAPGPPAKLAFTGQPSATQAGHVVSPAVRVAVQDALGNTVTSATTLVTIAIGTNPGGASLTGTLSQNAAGGGARFSNLGPGKGGAGDAVSPRAGGAGGGGRAGGLA